MCCHPMPHIWELLQGGILAYEGLQGKALVIGGKGLIISLHTGKAGITKTGQRNFVEVLCLKGLRGVVSRTYARMFWGDVTPVAPI